MKSFPKILIDDFILSSVYKNKIYFGGEKKLMDQGSTLMAEEREVRKINTPLNHS